MIDVVKAESVGFSTPRLARVTAWLDEQITSERFILIARQAGSMSRSKFNNLKKRAIQATST